MVQNNLEMNMMLCWDLSVKNGSARSHGLIASIPWFYLVEIPILLGRTCVADFDRAPIFIQIWNHYFLAWTRTCGESSFSSSCHFVCCCSCSCSRNLRSICWFKGRVKQPLANGPWRDWPGPVGGLGKVAHGWLPEKVKNGHFSQMRCQKNHFCWSKDTTILVDEPQKNHFFIAGLKCNLFLSERAPMNPRFTKENSLAGSKWQYFRPPIRPTRLNCVKVGPTILILCE